LRNLLLIIVAFVLPLVSQAQDEYGMIDFVENKGQWDDRVKFKGDVSFGSFFIRNGGVTVLQNNPEDYKKLMATMHGHEYMGQQAMRLTDKVVLRSHAYNIDFVNASTNLKVVPSKALETHANYFLGNDESKWAANCKVYQTIEMKEVYPNIDVRYYTHNNLLKYDIIVKPGGDVKKIALRYDGVDKLSIRNRELVTNTSLGDFVETYPYSYQNDGKKTKEIKVKYVVKNNIVTFDVQNYDPTATLVIDPTLVFCSFARSTGDNWGFTATYGPDGSFFGGGIVFGSGFPVSTGAFQTVYGGGADEGGGNGFDIGIIKLTRNGTNRVYATYIGGNGNEQPHSLVVDAAGNLVMAGRSNSANYPSQGVFGGGGGYDIVVTKLNATGSGILGSRRVGGASDDGVNITTSRSGPSSLSRNYGDDGRSEVILDGAGNVLVASNTKSAGLSFTAGRLQSTLRGSQDALILKFDPNLNNLIFGTYLGGAGNDAAYVLSVGPNGNIYVAGGTESQDLFTTPQSAGTVNPTKDNTISGYVAEISPDGNTLVKGTYLNSNARGANTFTQAYGIQFDRNGFVYVMGTTNGAWPLVNAVNFGSNAQQFIIKLQNDLSAYVYSTTFGSGGNTPNISPTAFLVDRCENVYVSGWGGVMEGYAGVLTGTTNSMVTTPNAVTPPGRSGRQTDGSDFYFFVMRRDAVGPAPLYASFYGQNGGFPDHVDGGTSRFDANGVIYQSMCAACGLLAPYPTTVGVWGATKPGSANCNLGMLKIQLDLAGVGSNVSSAIGGVPNDTAGCFPLEVTFTDQVLNATQYIWNFGDNGAGPIDQTHPDYQTFNIGPLPASTGFTQTHTFNTVGTYRVMMIAIDPSSCNIRDTSYISIRVGDLRANLVADIVKLAPCEAFNYRFDNLSTTDPSRPFSDTSFVWDFGDGSPRVIAGLNSLTHAYANPGTYEVRLVLRDTAYCNNPDSVTITLRVAANVEAAFDTPPSGCAPYTANFNNTSIGGLTFEWLFDDPASGVDNTSTLINPTHVFTNPGTYRVRLIANDPNTCNLIDTTFFTIVVNELPDAQFTFAPLTPEVNTPTEFTNQSSANAVRFVWHFGDGDTLATRSRSPVKHQYNSTGTFNACLIAFTNTGCSDTLCLPVSALIVPALDVPNAFTPNSGDENSIVKVRGFGIAKMRFMIWNRWGKKVFESNDRNLGWNGRVSGAVQPMDVYAYTLEVEFFDGTKASKKGDITLIR
jgi:gliding motility-associated-like protein